MPDTSPTIGFLGVGAMGGPMARNLQRAGHRVIAFDLRRPQLEACVAAGCSAVDSEAMVVAQAEIVLTSLPSSAVFLGVAEDHLLPNARRDQLFIDLGTTAPAQIRRLADAFAAKGAALVDAPVSGGPNGAERASLHVFVGGDPDAVERSLPVLHILGAPDHVVVCGPSGAGQLVKGVNQLAMGLGAAAALEALSYAVTAGIGPTAILQAVGGDEPWRKHFAGIARQVAEGRGENVFVKFPELPLFLDEAHAQDVCLPLTEALYAFCRKGDCRFRDNMNRVTVSFWHELVTQAQEPREAHR